VADEPSPTAITPTADAIPMKRYASPSDIAGAVLYLADGTDYVTGQVLLVDGGTSLQSIW
jgi:NAD(P)-dependent dehydrogenase (short-subunit alcohol dehydrogenase family)